jgi:hypothetical protein
VLNRDPNPANKPGVRRRMANEGSDSHDQVTMTRPAHTESEPMQALRRIALRYPDAQEGVVCTRVAFKARSQAFVFMGRDDNSYNVMLKLRDSLTEAAKLAAKAPNRYAVGGHGWVTATFRHDEFPPSGLLARWIDESYRLLVPKRLVALLPECGLPTAGSAQTAKTKHPKKTAKQKAPPR